jgi:anti-sigma regulatory factor (Ser/Thr protein kinase)
MAVSRDSQVQIRIHTSADIVVAREQGRALASQLGFSHSNLTIIATAISEVARNIVDYAKDGTVIITLITEAAREGVEIIASDAGPGIADVATVMRDGFSTGPGIGLPGARRLMDEFAIVSSVGQGTTVTMKKWVSFGGERARPTA